MLLLFRVLLLFSTRRRTEVSDSGQFWRTAVLRGTRSCFVVLLDSTCQEKPLFTRKAKRLQTWPANDHPYEGGRHAVGHLLLIIRASSELLTGCRPGRASRLESNLGLDVRLDHRMFSAMRSSCVQTLNFFRSTFLQCGCNSISAHHGPWLHFWLFLIQM